MVRINLKMCVVIGLGGMGLLKPQSEWLWYY